MHILYNSLNRSHFFLQPNTKKSEKKSIELNDLPNELLYKIFCYMQERKDVSNWLILSKRFNEFGKNSLDRLPFEIWGKIFNYLDSPADIRNIKQTSIVFNRLYHLSVPERLKKEDQFEAETLNYRSICQGLSCPRKKEEERWCNKAEITIIRENDKTFFFKDQQGKEFEGPIPEQCNSHGKKKWHFYLGLKPFIYKDKQIIFFFDKNDLYMCVYKATEDNKCKLAIILPIPYRGDPFFKTLFNQKEFLIYNKTNKNIHVFDLETLENKCNIDLSIIECQMDVQFQDSTIFCTFDNAKKIQVFDSRNGKLISALKKSKRFPDDYLARTYQDCYLAQLVDGYRLQKQLTVWDITTGKLVFERTLPLQTTNRGIFNIELELSSRNKKNFKIRVLQNKGLDDFEENIFTYAAPKEENGMCAVQ